MSPLDRFLGFAKAGLGSYNWNRRSGNYVLGHRHGLAILRKEGVAMDCCNVNGLNEIFNKSRAAKESRKYLRKGLDRRATMVVGFLRDQSVSGASKIGRAHV